MSYFRLILAMALIVFAVFALHKYTPDMVQGAQLLSAVIFNVISSR